MSKNKIEKRYLGDGLYADNDGYNIILTAENGIEATDTVFLEPQVYESLLKYVEDARKLSSKE